MKSYIQLKSEAGFDDLVAPKPEYVWYAYKKGEVVGAYNTESEAKEHATLVEKVQTNKQECDEHYKKVVDLERLINAQFDVALRHEYQHLNDEVYEICYSKAWDRGHAYGHDEVAAVMVDAVDFAEKILRAGRAG